MKTLNASNLSHPSTLARIKHAVILAVRMASRHGFAQVHVVNRKGDAFLRVSVIRGQSFRVQATDHSDVSDVVKSSLQRWHTPMAKDCIRIKNVRLSFPPLYAPFIPSKRPIWSHTQ